MVDTGHSAAGWVMGKSLSSPQECLSHQQVLSTWQQTQKLLSAQEAAHLQGQLQCDGVHLQLCVCPVETCPQLLVRLEGQKLGQSMWMGHDIHFVCDIGFWLVGSESHTCRHDYTWSSTQPFCRREGERDWGTVGLAPAWAQPGSHAPPSPPSCMAPSSCSPGDCLRLQDCRKSSPEAAVMGTRAVSKSSWVVERAHPTTWRPSHPFLAPWPCSSLLLPDVDECQLFQSSPQTRICLHDCLKLPSSWRVLLLCPPGYVLHTDRNTCDDVNECARNQHKCTRSDLCIDIFGGHRCICPKCPLPRHNTSYVKTSTLGSPAPWTAGLATSLPPPSPSTTCHSKPTVLCPMSSLRCLPPVSWVIACTLP
uniref:Sushi domain-containing protein n=1 Tax=Apteryx owenii TaxID=8824 RepID=A0A8B9P7Z0_APTOW